MLSNLCTVLSLGSSLSYSCSELSSGSSLSDSSTVRNSVINFLISCRKRSSGDVILYLRPHGSCRPASLASRHHMTHERAYLSSQRVVTAGGVVQFFGGQQAQILAWTAVASLCTLELFDSLALNTNYYCSLLPPYCCIVYS